MSDFAAAHFIRRHGDASACGTDFPNMVTTLERLTTCEDCKTALKAERDGLESGEFVARDLLEHLLERFPCSYVEQTGGGTATLYITKHDADVPITAGPGSYNWDNPGSSLFYTGEFYWGRDDYDRDGEEFPEPAAPGGSLDDQDPELPVDFAALAERIAAEYAKYN